MTKARFHYLYKCYINNVSTADELVEFSTYLNHPDFKDDIDGLLEQAWGHLSQQDLPDIPGEKADAFYDLIVARRQPKRAKPYLWLKVAASIIVLLSLGLITYVYHHKTQSDVAARLTKPYVQDIMPGMNKAILTLSNGRKVMLDTAAKGQIAQQQGIVISKNKSSQLVYVAAVNDATAAATKSDIQYNTITVPKGGEYSLLLADGTHVYLNAASSLTYPTDFKGNTREVSLTGEAYFEVAKNRQKPFKVNVNNQQQVEVLGTHFNIEAYNDDRAITTTLIEGSVKLLSNGKQAVLKPGQTAINNGTSFQIAQSDIDEVMAWRNGIFIFNNENITSLMKRISRWYNIDVEFVGDMKNISFIGSYPRSKSLADLIKNIELTEKVHFLVQERRVTVIEKK